MLTLNDYINNLEKSIRHHVLKIEFLRDEDESPFYTITQDYNSQDIRTGGNITTQNGSGKRRAISLVLNNMDGKFLPDIDGYLGIQRKIKLYLGEVINNEIIYFPKGVYVMENPNVTSKPSDAYITLNCNDKFSLLDGTNDGELDYIWVINSGTNLKTALQTLLTDAGETKPIIFDSYYDSVTVPYTIIKEEGQTYGDIILELADFLSANVYYNEEGFLVFEKDYSDSIKGSLYDFDDSLNKGITYMSSDITYNFSDVYNSVLVIGDNVNGNLARYVVENTDLTSSTAIGNIPKRTLVVYDDLISTDALAEQRGIYELKRVTKVLINGSMECGVMYHLDVDGVITLTDAHHGFNRKRLVIEGISYNFGSNTITLNVADSFELNL